MSIADVILHPLRRAAAALGETGAFVIMILSVPTGTTMISPTHHPLTNAIGILLIACTVAAVFMRSAEHRGGKAVRAVRKRGKASVEQLEAAMLLGVSVGSNAATVRAAAVAAMKSGHSDTGTGGVDMDAIKTARETLMACTDDLDAPGATRLLAVWRREAGIGGQLWGWLFPDGQLTELRRASGESLWPRRTA